MSNINTGLTNIPDTLTWDVWGNSILTRVDLTGWSALSRTNTIWLKELQHRLFPEFLERKQIKIGKDALEKIPGVENVGEEPKLSAEQLEKLKKRLLGKCPFFNKPDPVKAHRFEDGTIKMAWQTHKLILLPETINGEPRTANLVGKIFHSLKEGQNETAYDTIPGNEDAEFRKEPAPKSHFVLVTMDVVPGSRGQIKGKNNKKENLVKCKGYRGPGPNEAITSIMIMNLCSAETTIGYYFDQGDPKDLNSIWTYTITTENFEGCPLIVGGVSRKGIRVRNRSDAETTTDVGIAAFLDI